MSTISIKILQRLHNKLLHSERIERERERERERGGGGERVCVGNMSKDNWDKYARGDRGRE